jgi:hypothetical protein
MANSGPGNFAAVAFLGGANVEAIAAGKTLTASDATFQKLDPAGGPVNVDLPAEASSNGLWFYIMNDADAAETITVRNDAAGTVVTLPQNEAAIVICDGTTWVHMGILTIQRS